MKIEQFKLEEGKQLKIPMLEFLDIQIVNGEFVMWAVVNDSRHRMNSVDCKFFMTGQEVDMETLRNYDHKATLRDDMGMVWHVFLRVS